MTRLLEIYGALAAMNVTLNASVVSVAAYNSKIVALHTAQVPIRILGALGEQDSASFEAVTLDGSTVATTWTLTDLALLEAANQSTLADNREAMVRYEVAYVTAIKANIRLLKPGVVVRRVRMSRGVFQYPAGSNQWWYGVECRPEIEEVG